MTVACSIVHFKGYVNKCIYQSFFGSNELQVHPRPISFYINIICCRKGFEKSVSL